MSVLSAVLDARVPARSGSSTSPPPCGSRRRSWSCRRRSRTRAGSASRSSARYDDRGPAWYWNDIHTGEHTGTHLDAPVHWVSGKDGLDVSQAPLSTLVGAAAVIDMTAQVEVDADFLLEVEHVRAWEAEHGPLPEGGWLLCAPAGRRAATTRPRSPTPTRTARTRRASPRSAPAGSRRSRRSAGFGIETVGTDAGAAHGFDPPFACHNFLMGATSGA